MNNASEITTNYDKSKSIVRALVGKRLSSCESAFCLYLIDQQYGYTADKGVDGESSGYGHIASIVGNSPTSIKRAVKSLVSRNIILKEINATRYGNRYRFNENTDEWTSSNPDTSSKTDTSSKDDTGEDICTHRVQVETVGKPLHSSSGDTPNSSKTSTTTGSSPDTRVVAELTPNNKVSTVNNPTINNQTVNDSSAFLISFKNKNDRNDDAKALEGYTALLSKSFPSLDVTKEFIEFQKINPDVKGLKDIGKLFTEWCIDANNKSVLNKQYRQQ